MDWDRFDKALFRCLNDIEIVKAQRTAHQVLRKTVSNSRDVRSGFPGLVNAAFSFSTQGVLALILEKQTTKGRSGFWWVHREALNHVSGYSPEQEDIDFLNEFSSAIKVLRDKSLFHISEITLHDPKTFRQNTGLTYRKMDKAISVSLATMREILKLRRGSTTWSSGTLDVATLHYDGSDIPSIFD
ncbi:MAG: hypothetical protein QGH73_01310 [Rhodospirillales bacterium]|jgi:hypothetical protein|nr:hypothetical protein [Rhodospirillales bacterium]MDP6644570.1 hypothetical protein [Rhodospirillales bacterium]MDP6840296.1 hypothetical protein [Rhodospirillales bacterium]|tara:strand:+ start:1922 stop:2479 length:558 start_codon:yes stop_codon:yes gene_type:complete